MADNPDLERASGSTVTSLLRIIGGWGRPSGSGRGLFMFHLSLVASTTAALSGVGCAALFGMIFQSGTIGFVAGSCIGYVAGAANYYRSCLAQSLLALQEHPKLLHLHLINNFPLSGYQKWRFVADDGHSINQEAFARIKDNWALSGHLVSAWTSAGPVLEDIYAQKQQVILAEIQTLDKV